MTLSFLFNPSKILFFSALLSLSQAASAGHSWLTYHWDIPTNETELALTLNNNLSGSWPGYLTLTAVDWNASSVIDLSVAIQTNTSCAAMPGKAKICNAMHADSGWLGIAGITVEGGHITAGYVMLNDYYFSGNYSGGYYDTSSWRQMVMCQEVGHIFGLSHQDEKFKNKDKMDGAGVQTCMDYTDKPAGNGQPNQHDYDQLLTIYQHNLPIPDDGEDPSTSCAKTIKRPGGGGNNGKGGGNGNSGGDCTNSRAIDVLNMMDMHSPAQFGRLISKHGGSETYELDLGSGKKIITHVTWALEHVDGHQH